MLLPNFLEVDLKTGRITSRIYSKETDDMIKRNLFLFNASPQILWENYISRWEEQECMELTWGCHKMNKLLMKISTVNNTSSIPFVYSRVNIFSICMHEPGTKERKYSIHLKNAVRKVISNPNSHKIYFWTYFMGPSREKAAAAAEEEDSRKAKRSDEEKQDISMILINSIVFDSRLGIYLNKFTWIFVQYHSEDEKNFSGNKRNLTAIAADGTERKQRRRVIREWIQFQ